MRLLFKEYTLNEAAVDAISADAQDYLNKLNAERRSVQKIRLTVEEILLNIMEHYGKGMTISVGFGKQFGRHMFRLRYTEEPFNPTKKSDNPLAEEVMRALGVFPAWSCRGKTNTVSLVLADRPKRSMLFYITLAVVAAVILGILGNFIPESVRLAVNDAVLSPLSDCFLGLLNIFAGIMILLTICNGILGMGDSATLGRTGKSIIVRFVGISFAVSAFSAVSVLPFVNLNYSAGGQGSDSAFKQISQMFFDIIPKNIIDPFKTGNTFHIIVIAVFIGCALLAVGERGSRMRALIEDASAVFQQIVSTICALVPLFVFSMLLQLIWSGKIRILVSVIKPIILIAVLVIILVVLLLIIYSIRLKCPPMLLMKKVMPAFLVAFTSASSVSAFQIGMETCESKFGINKSLTSFAYPLGAVVYMPASVIYFTVLVCTFAETYQIATNVPWFILAVIITTLITIAMPPIPGGDILCYTVLFSSLGIPSEAIILATAVGILLDHLDTGVNVMLLIFRLTSDAKRLDNLDKKILLSE